MSYSENGDSDSSTELFQKVTTADSNRLQRGVSQTENLEPKHDRIDSKDKEGDFRIRQARRNIHIAITYVSGAGIVLFIVAFFVVVFFAGKAFVEFKLSTDGGILELVQTGAGIIGVAAVTILVTKRVEQFFK